MFSKPAHRAVAWALLYLCAAALVIGVVYMIVSTNNLTQAVRDTQIEGTPTGQKLLSSSDRILDCTEPSGDCFKASQKRTARAVGDINEVIVLAAACSAGLPDDMSVAQRQAHISTCVLHRLALTRD